MIAKAKGLWARLTGRAQSDASQTPDPLFVRVYSAPVERAFKPQATAKVLQSQTVYHTDSVS